MEKNTGAAIADHLEMILVSGAFLILCSRIRSTACDHDGHTVIIALTDGHASTFIQTVICHLKEYSVPHMWKAEQAAKVDKMRQSILEGLHFTRPSHPLPFPPPPAMPFYPAAVYPRPFGPMPPPPGRGRGFSGVQPMPSQGGKLEIAGTVVGQWAGTRRGRGRGPFPIQVVSVGGPTRGRPRGVISTPVIRTFGRGGRYYGRGAYKNQGTSQTKPPYATSAAEVAKELKTQSEDSKSSAVSSDGSLTENGVGNEESQASQINGGSADTQPPNPSESALSSDSKACNTNPHLNALDPDSGHREEETLEASVLKKEE